MLTSVSAIPGYRLVSFYWYYFRRWNPIYLLIRKTSVQMGYPHVAVVNTRRRAEKGNLTLLSAPILVFDTLKRNLSILPNVMKPEHLGAPVCVSVCNLRTIRPGWTSGSLRRGEANATSPTRATTLGGRSTQTSTVWFTPNISSWPPIWMTWRRTPSATGTSCTRWLKGLLSKEGFSFQKCLPWKRRRVGEMERYSPEVPV